MYWKRPNLPVPGASLEPQTAAFAIQTHPAFALTHSEPLIHRFTMSPAKSRCDTFEKQHSEQESNFNKKGKKRWLFPGYSVFSFWVLFQNGCKILLKY